MPIVRMPEGDYLREHMRLIKLLDASKNPRMKREASRQRNEVKTYLKKRYGYVE
jgi:glutaredoxin 2